MASGVTLLFAVSDALPFQPEWAAWLGNRTALVVSMLFERPRGRPLALPCRLMAPPEQTLARLRISAARHPPHRRNSRRRVRIACRGGN